MITKLIYRQLDSTRLEYERLAKTGSDQDRWVVRAETQKAGQGRGENLWHSPEGGLWLSFDLFYPQPIASFSLYIGFCLHSLLTQLYGLPKLRLKWPNDIYLGGKKLAGILCNYHEHQSRYLVSLGINTNVKPDDVLLELNAAILSNHIGLPVSNMYLEELLINRVKKNSDLLATPQTYLGYCLKYLYGLGQEAELDTGNKVIHGRIAGLNDAGFLVLKINHDTIKTISHGSLRIL